MMGQPFGGDAGISGHKPTRDMVNMKLGAHGVSQNRHAQTRLLQFEKTAKHVTSSAASSANAPIFTQQRELSGDKVTLYAAPERR